MERQMEREKKDVWLTDKQTLSNVLENSTSTHKCFDKFITLDTILTHSKREKKNGQHHFE